MNALIIIAYIILIILNRRAYINGGKYKSLSFITSCVAIFFLCGTNVASDDSLIGMLDLASYRNEYMNQDPMQAIDFNFYYLFFCCQKIGQLLGMSYETWWLTMSVASILVIHLACVKHNYNYNLLIACFLAYYEIVFYSGLKFYYGFVFLLLAYGYLLRNTKKDKLLFSFFIAIAGGFHIMYYMFLILLIRPIKNQKRFVISIVVLAFLLTFAMRVTGSVISFMKPFFDSLGSDHINTYVDEAVGLGFYIAIILELVMIYIPYKVRQYKQNDDAGVATMDAFLYSVLMTLLFCPFYAVSLIFVRLITSFSLVVIAASSSFTGDIRETRLLSSNLSFAMVFAYLIKQLFLDACYGNWAFLKQSIIPYFDIFK